MDENLKQRAEQLRRELEEHNHRYYVLNEPSISDREFDMMMHELEDIERAHPELDDPLSPTHRVGSDLGKGFKQAEHIYAMLSLANTYSPEEVDQWLERTRTSLMGEDVTIVGELKFDARART